MKLRKATRKALREAAAKHESITIEWPPSAPEPEIGRRYPLSSFDPDARLRVEKRHRAEVESGWEAEVRLDYDQVRILYGLSPVKNDKDETETEPERVDSRYEKLLASEGRIKTAMQGNLNRRNQAAIRREGEMMRENRKGAGSGANAARRRAGRLPRRRRNDD